MMKRPILIHPDPRLRKVCDPVTEFDGDLRALADEMFSTMYQAPGIGLAAPQVGMLTRMFVVDCANRDAGETPEPLAMVNPEIIERSDETNEHEEGCLSFPQMFAFVTRPAAVRMRYQDPDGTEHERDFDGLWATCVQHELDHLNGKLFIDHIGPMRRQMINSKMKKLKREMARG